MLPLLRLALFVFPFVCLHRSLAQAPTPATEFKRAASLYYIPTDKGLESFKCDVGFDWKELLSKASGTETTDDNPVLIYLKSIKLTVHDRFSSVGDLVWSADDSPPDAVAGSVQQIQDGMQQTFHGFFDTWNKFMDGDMVTVTDDKTRVERHADGYRLVAEDAGDVVEEKFTPGFTLKTFHVHTKDLEVTMKPVFASTPDGMIVSSMVSTYRQPLTAPATEITESVEYQLTEGFRLPSRLVVNVSAAPELAFSLSNCTVKKTTPSEAPAKP